MSKDLNYIIKVERAISEKYGDETIKNPKANWTQEKENDYLQQLKQLVYYDPDESDEKVNVNGVFLPIQLITKESINRICISCKVYSFSKKDDLYMNKFKTCFKCYLNYIEGREDKWMKKLAEQDSKK